MTRTELNKFRTMLNAKHTELAQATHTRDGIVSERTPDELDEVQ
jgi:hypothetical protein